MKIGLIAPEKTIPHDVEAEEAVLGSLLIDPDALYRVASFLRPEDFYIQKNGWIYEAILALHDRREPVDLVTLRNELEARGILEEVGGVAYLARLIDTVPTAIHVEAYGRIVEEAAIRRRLISAASDIAQLAYQEAQEIGEVLDRAEQSLFAISQRRITRDLVPIQEVVRPFYDRIEYLYTHQGEPLGVPTGFIDLDKLLGGLQKSDLIIVAARPGVGKTSFCLSIARNAARMGKHVAIFSLEMSAEQVVQRLVSAETGIDAQRLRLGQLREEEWPLLVQATGVLSELPIFIDDTPAISALQLRTKARRIHAEYGLDLIVVDYLQLMTSDVRVENRVQEVSYISRMLKSLARELDVPLLAVSQLSRAVEQRTDKRPVLADLRESGCLTGETLVQLADGRRIPIGQLAREGNPVRVMALNEQTWKLEPVEARKAWRVGIAPVYRLRTRLGREIRATANHRFRTIEGWKRLDQLKAGEPIAALSKTNLSRERALPVGQIVQSEELIRLSQSDVYWDRVASIEGAGEEEVFDLEVPGHHNFVAGDIIVHNSLEQDADVVMFIYREEMYKPETEKQHIADIIVAKHRHGPTRTIQLFFREQLAQFLDAETRLRPVEFA
ncbi:MAG: replicative DNA helicase [Anaerolineae bacterium]